MKKLYETPLLEVEEFKIRNQIMTDSASDGGIGDNGEDVEF